MIHQAKTKVLGRFANVGLPRKKRRLGKFKGYKTQYKKVIITLDPKDNIQLFSDI